MTARKRELNMEQGTTYRRTFRLSQSNGDTVDLTGATAAMQAWDREHRTKLIDFNEQGTVTVGGTDGTVTIYLSGTVTCALAFDVAKYDLKITSPNPDKTRLIEGRIRLTPQETV